MSYCYFSFFLKNEYTIKTIFISYLTFQSEATVTGSFVLDRSWFHVSQRTVHIRLTWLPTLHIPLWSHWVCVYMHMCVFVDSEWGLFRGFTAAPSGCVCQGRNLGMCSSNKRDRGERKRARMGQQAFSQSSTPCGVIFHTVDPDIPPVCVSVYA